MRIILPGEYTTLNPYIDAERTHRQMAATIKRVETRRVYWELYQHEPVDEYPVKMSFYWYCKNKRTDPDNVVFARKFILDGLQQAGVIVNDGWNQIGEFHDYMRLDPENPRVEIVIDKLPVGEHLY